MKVDTKYQGQVEIEDTDIIRFENGLPGFLDEKQFVILPFSEGVPFFILQSTRTASLAFVIADPFSFYKDYDFVISEGVIDQLDIETEKDVAVYTMLTIRDPFEQTTTNLQAPVICNIRTQKAKQIVLNDDDYSTQHMLVKPNSSTVREG